MNLKNATQSERITELIDRYAEFKSSKAKEEEARAARLSDSLGTFWPQFAEAVTASKARERSEAPKFNLIRLLDLHQLERNHSKILAELLNPSGSHAQGSLFLETFLDQIGRGDLKQTLPNARVDVRTETWITENGRLDIVIRCFSHFLLVIENKIRSDEGKGPDGRSQLEKYSDWLDKQTGCGETILVYLTIHADQPKKVANVKAAGYLRDVHPWIEKCLESVQAPRVRESVAQYLEMIEELRNLREERKSGDQ